MPPPAGFQQKKSRFLFLAPEEGRLPFAHVCAFVQRRQVRYRKGKIASFAEAVKEDWKKEKEEEEAGISSPLRAPPKKDSSSSLAGRFLPFFKPKKVKDAPHGHALLQCLLYHC